MRQFELLVPVRFGNCIGRVKKDPAANFSSVVCFSETLMQIRLVTAPFLVVRRAGLSNRLLKLVGEVETVFSGSWRCFAVVKDCEVRGKSRQCEAKWSSTRGTLDVEIVRFRDSIRVFIPVLRVV